MCIFYVILFLSLSLWIRIQLFKNDMSGIFKIGGHVIVPSHGLGKLVNKLTKKIGENDIELLEIFF